MGAIFIQAIKFQRKSLLFWTIGIIGLITLYMALYPSIQSSAKELNATLEKLPEGFREVFIDNEVDYASPIGYISSEIYSQMLPIIFLIFAIGFGSGAVAGEEEKGTLDIVLSTPIRRSRLVIEKFIALVVLLTFFSSLIVVSLYLGVRIINIDVGLGPLISATFNLLLLGLNFGAIAFFLGSLTGSKGLAIGLTTAFAVLTFMINAFYRMADPLEKIKEFSPFFHYQNQNALLHGVDWASASLLIWATLALFALSIAAFAKRDLNV